MVSFLSVYSLEHSYLSNVHVNMWIISDESKAQSREQIFELICYKSQVKPTAKHELQKDKVMVL